MKQSNKNKKMFSAFAFDAGSFFGGVLPPVYFFYKNYKNQGKIRKAVLSAITGAFVYFIFLTIAFSVQGPLRFIVPFVVWIATRVLFAKLQKKQVDEFVAAGGKTYGKRAVFVTILGIAITFYLLISPVLIYNQNVKKIHQNDLKAVGIMQGQGTSAQEYLIDRIESATVLYRENEKLLNEAGNTIGLAQANKDDVSRIKKYTQLRLEILELTHKAVVENSEAYNEKIEMLANEIVQYQIK